MYRKPDYLLGLVAAIILVAACTGTSVKPQTSEQQAFYLYGTYVTASEIAAKLVLSDSVPMEVKAELRGLAGIAKPAADIMFSAAEQVVSLREANADPAKVDAAIAGLDAAFADALPKIRSLMFAIKEYQDGPADPSRPSP